MTLLNVRKVKDNLRRGGRGSVIKMLVNTDLLYGDQLLEEH